jgi:hypothetical protein
VETKLALPDKTTTELFDLSKDIGETNDLAGTHPEKIVELLKLIDKARIPNKDFPIPVLDIP